MVCERDFSVWGGTVEQDFRGGLVFVLYKKRLLFWFVLLRRQVLDHHVVEQPICALGTCQLRKDGVLIVAGGFEDVAPIWLLAQVALVTELLGCYKCPLLIKDASFTDSLRSNRCL